MPHGQLVRSQTSFGRKWDVYRAPVTSSDTLITTWDRPAGFRNLATVRKIEFDKLRVRFFGRDLADETATIHLSGWFDDGPGMDMGEIALILGTLAYTVDFPDNGTQAVTTAFNTTATWLEVDTYTFTTDREAIFSQPTVVANAVSYMEIDLSKSRYSYMMTEIVLGTAAEMGAIFVPVG